MLVLIKLVVFPGKVSSVVKVNHTTNGVVVIPDVLMMWMSPLSSMPCGAYRYLAKMFCSARLQRVDSQPGFLPGEYPTVIHTHNSPQTMMFSPNPSQRLHVKNRGCVGRNFKVSQ